MDFIEFLNKKTNNKYKNVKLTEVTFVDEICTCKFVYNGENGNLSDSEKDEIIALIEDFIGVPCKVKAKFKKESLDYDVIFQYVSTFIQRYYPSAYSTFGKESLKIESNENETTLNFYVLDIYYKYLIARNFEKELNNYLLKFYTHNFIIKLFEIDSENDVEKALEEQEIKVQQMVCDDNVEVKNEWFEVLEVRKLIGDELDCNCEFYEDFNKPVDNVLTAGKILNIYEKTYKSKYVKNEEDPKEKVFYSLKLELRGKTLDCVYFPKDQDLANFQTLSEGDEIVINGDIKEYNGRLSCTIRQISLCKLPEIKEPEIEWKKVNSEYKFAKPEEYVVEEQADLFSFNKVEEVNDILKNNTFVVFDFETTGLNFMENEIIEIGAVKIINGKIRQTFDTFVKPLKVDKLPSEIVKLTHITDDMVFNAHPISDVIQDFYKFCDGCIMVGHNSIGFDNLFLQKAGRENRYNFDNKQLDTYIISMQLIKGIRNYKLKTIAEYLNVKLENAHRAIFDVLATAEVFIKLTDKMKSI